MSTLLCYPQFSYMLKNFLSIDDLLEFIGEKSASPQATQNLEDQIDFLMGQCNVVLAKSNEQAFGEKKSQNFSIPISRSNNWRK